ncbi:BLUF domain-containing protein [Gramella sp. GC03-9]|uniref:BLUF domain-containing protein n=1 Tax=Christiangramia oceanisediminis TaxID=2920386 RepID=A0A9X2KVA0_9FLAO|nr:BLUF domain-containing protein [Gramella oceanisediminis]MCP9198465.1 BLUF domain-containing protein [Gramella oceanisediminis]
MRYAISYVSTATKSLNNQEIENILKNAEVYNNQNDITGLLLYSEGNFFQIIEGETEKVNFLYKKILNDYRHKDIIQLFKKPIKKESFDGYKSDFISEDARYNISRLQNYQHYIEVLDKPTQKAVSNILRAFLV